jgi:hypothetical protein
MQRLSTSDIFELTGPRPQNTDTLLQNQNLLPGNFSQENSFDSLIQPTFLPILGAPNVIIADNNIKPGQLEIPVMENPKKVNWLLILAGTTAGLYGISYLFKGNKAKPRNVDL